jgi:hypothetical protein
MVVYGNDSPIFRRTVAIYRQRMTDEDMAMTVRELRAALATIEAHSEVQVVLFKNDGTSQVFELEEVLSLDGHAQLEIYEAEEAESPPRA